MELLYTPNTNTKNFKLENSENFLIGSLINNLSSSFSNFQNIQFPIEKEFESILLYARDESEILTFDRTHKIRVIIPKDKLIEKILTSPTFARETEFNKHRVTFLNPAFDIKLGFDFSLKKFYANFVILCENYTKTKKFKDKNFLRELRKNDFVEQNKIIIETFSKVFDSLKLEKVLQRLSETNFFGFRNQTDFWDSNEFLILSNKFLPKLNKRARDEFSLIVQSDFDLNIDMSHSQQKEISLFKEINLNVKTEISPAREKSENKNEADKENEISVSSNKTYPIMKKFITNHIKFKKQTHKVDMEFNLNDKRFKSFTNSIPETFSQEENRQGN
jgi:hypothetical protein